MLPFAGVSLWILGTRWARRRDRGIGMGRKVRDASLETRSARLKLPIGGKPRWRLIESGLHLGYRRPKNGSGTWIARRYVGKGVYQEKKFGIADDFTDVDPNERPADDDRTIRTF